MRLHIITFGAVLFLVLTCIQPSVASEAVSPTNQSNLSYINNVDKNELILLSLAIENQIQKATAILVTK